MTKSTKITKDTLLSDAVSAHPEIIPAFLKHGMHCIGCHAATFESIEAGAIAHGMKDEEVNKLIEEINQIIANEQGETTKREARKNSKK